MVKVQVFFILMSLLCPYYYRTGHYLLTNVAYQKKGKGESVSLIINNYFRPFSLILLLCAPAVHNINILYSSIANTAVSSLAPKIGGDQCSLCFVPISTTKLVFLLLSLLLFLLKQFLGKRVKKMPGLIDRDRSESCSLCEEQRGPKKRGKK